MLTPTETAQAFSGHRFAEAYPMLADDVVWDNVNGPQLSGREAVIAACEETLGFLRHATTTFSRFVTVTGPDAVVVDVNARYVGDDGSDTSVASCDLYAFTDGCVGAVLLHRELHNEDAVLLDLSDEILYRLSAESPVGAQQLRRSDRIDGFLRLRQSPHSADQHQSGQDGPDYQVDHSGSVYLFGPGEAGAAQWRQHPSPVRRRLHPPTEDLSQGREAQDD